MSLQRRKNAEALARKVKNQALDKVTDASRLASQLSPPKQPGSNDLVSSVSVELMLLPAHPSVSKLSQPQQQRHQNDKTLRSSASPMILSPAAGQEPDSAARVSRVTLLKQRLEGLDHDQQALIELNELTQQEGDDAAASTFSDRVVDRRFSVSSEDLFDL